MMLGILSAVVLLAQTTVTLSPQPAGSLRADFELNAPKETFVFGQAGKNARSHDWNVIGEGWSFDGQKLRRLDGAPLARFAVSIAPYQRQFNRVYVPLDSIGEEGRVLFLAPFGAEEGGTTLRFTGFPEGSVLRVEGETKPLSEDLALELRPQNGRGGDQRVAYIGPPRYIRPADEKFPLAVIAGPEIPLEVAALARETAGSAMAVLTKQFGQAPSAQPTISISHRDDIDANRWKADAAQGGFIAYHFPNIDLDISDPQIREALTQTAVHEFVHLWNGGVWRHDANAEHPWLDEGAAEYIAVRFMSEKGEVITAAGDHLERCVRRLGTRALGRAAPYDCGFFVQFIAEHASLRAQQGDIIDLWADVFSGADADGTYSRDDFVAEAEARGGQAFRDVFVYFSEERAGDPLRWAGFGTALSAVGITASSRPSDEREGAYLLRNAMMDVLRELCEMRSGFWSETDVLRLDTGDRCGEALAGDPEINAVNGIDLFEDPFAAFNAIRETCAEGEGIVFRLKAGDETAPVTCDAAIADPPPVIELLDAPPLPDLH